VGDALFELAEFELHHSRPIAPTRRLALGLQYLPCNPPPGPGGILLAGIVARYVDLLSDDDLADLEVLMHDIEAGRRIVQPRLRHRLQTDRVGLLKSVHHLRSDGEGPEFAFAADLGSPLVNALGAVYAAGNLPGEVRSPVFAALRRALRWQGPIDGGFVAPRVGGNERAGWLLASSDPVSWALDVLGFDSEEEPSKREIRKRFRDQLRHAHPDHGADEVGAADRIADLAEARRILLG
jgi:hypothetical protein